MPLLPPINPRLILATLVARLSIRLAALSWRLAGEVDTDTTPPRDVAEGDLAWTRDAVVVNTNGGVA